jgi:hypothetical protein
MAWRIEPQAHALVRFIRGEILPGPFSFLHVPRFLAVRRGRITAAAPVLVFIGHGRLP